MPFTPSHAAAALLFTRTRLPVAAFVIGTLSPDLLYFVPFDIDRDFTHSWLGLVTLDLGIGLVSLGLWFVFLRAPVVDLLPRSIGRRMLPARREPGMIAMPESASSPMHLVVAALLLGSLTHVLWDSFTHDGWLASQLPLLTAEVASRPLHQLLHWASSVFGIAVIAVWLRGWLKRTAEVSPAPRSIIDPRLRVVAWGMICVVAGLAAVVSMAVGIANGSRNLVFEAATSGVSAAGLLVSALCLLWHVRSRRLRRNP